MTKGEWKGVRCTTEAELRLPVARVRIDRYFFDRPLDEYCVHNTYRLDLGLIPRPRDARACFRDGGSAHRFEPLGDLWFLPPGEALQTRGTCGQQSSLVCEFEPEAVRAWFDGDLHWTAQRLRASLDIANHDIRAALLRLKNELRNPGFASEALCELFAAQAAIELARYFKAASEVRTTGRLSSRSLKLIDERLAEIGPRPTLSELAKLSNLSVRQMARAFRASRGCSIGEYISRSRINSAKHLLATRASVKEVSYRLGFSSPANFSTAFHHATGESPRTFQQHNRIT